MKKLIKLIPLFLSFSISLCLASCSNSVGGSNNSENKTVVFHGSFSIDESFLSKNSSSVMTSRSAQPTIPDDTNLTYYAKATNGSEIILSQDLTADKTFSIPLKTGSIWTIEVGAKGTSAINNSEAILIKDTIVFNPADDEPTKEYKFYLRPYISGGSGKLNLRIKIQDPSGNKIEKVEIVPKKCLSNPENPDAVTFGWSGLAPFWNSDKKAVCFTSNLDDFTISRNGFKSGIWEVAVNFKDSEDQLLYSSIQIICVYDNLETKTWESSKTVADSNELIVSTGEDAGVLYLTTLLVDAYGLTDFYVDKNGTHDDSDNGSPMKPFETITKAIAVVNGLGRLDKTYTIHVKQGNNPTQEIYETINEPITITSNLSIECYSTREGDREGTVIISSTNSNGPILQIGDGNKTSVLTIDGIRKDNNNTPLNISDDTWTGLQLVSNRSSSGLYTRGVDIKANGSLFMNGGSITGNTCNNTGAGVHISSYAYFIFTGGRITGNNSGTNSGGGIYVASNGDLLMKGGVVTGNTGSTGAGIYAEGNITIGGTCYILENTANSAKSNIYLPDNKLIKINGSLEGSKIGITTQTAPSIGNNIRFTDGYAYGKRWCYDKYVDENNEYNEQGEINYIYIHPYKFFQSDIDGYSIIVDPTQDNPATEEVDEATGDVCLGISGGTITQYTAPEVTISLSKNEDEYTITAEVTPADSNWAGCNSTNTNAVLKKNDVELSSTFWTYTATETQCKATLLNTLPAGTYVLEVDVTYNSRVYTAIFNITKS